MKSVLDRLLLYLVRPFIGLLGALPVAVSLPIARGIVAALCLLMPRLRRVADRNLELAFPGLAVDERARIRERSLENLASNLVWFARVPRLTPSQIEEMFDYGGARAFLADVAARHQGKGMLFITGHFGNFELLLQAQVMMHRPAAVLARGFGLPRLDDWWNGRRERWGATVFGRKGGYQEAVARLRDGQDVLMMCDQNVKANYATFAQFFGIQAATTKTPAIAALRTGCAVIFGTCVEVSPGRYQPVYEEISNPSSEPGSREEQIRRFTERFNAAIEAVVRRYPEQWFWIHRRWKTRPPGETETLYVGC